MMKCGAYLLLLLLSPLAHAQEAERTEKIYIGLDVLKPFLWSLEGGYVLEPMAKIAISHRVYANALLGSCHLRRDHVYQNLSYRNQGIYGKVGLEYFFIYPGQLPAGVVLSGGLNGVYSKFNESGTVVLKGAYFGDVTQGFSQSHLHYWGIEHTFNFGFLLLGNQRLFLNTQFRLDISLKPTVGQVFPVYHVPGAGTVLHNKETRMPDDGNVATGGITVQLFYKIF